MPAEFSRPIARRFHAPGVGDFVATMEREGIRMRAHGCRKSVVLPWAELARRALEADGHFWLSSAQWDNPLAALAKLPPRGRTGGRRKLRRR